MATGRRAAPPRPTAAVVLDICGALARLVLAAGWLGAGAAQLARHRPLHDPGTVDPIQPAGVLDTVGALLPWVALGLGALLLLGIGIRITAALALALELLLFIGAAAAPWSRLNVPIDYSCRWDRTCLAIPSGSEDSALLSPFGGVGVAVLCLWLIVRPRCALAMDNLLTSTAGRNRRRRPAHAAATARSRRRNSAALPIDTRPD